MSDNKEIQELKEQINNLKDIVTRLEQGETKYERPDLILRKRKNELYDKILGKRDEANDVHIYWARRECFVNSCTKIVNQIFKAKRNCKSNDNIRSLVTTSVDIEEYCGIYERFLNAIVEEEKEGKRE